MQNADVILSMLGRKSTQNRAFVFDRLYRNLFNPDFYQLAYRNIHTTAIQRRNREESTVLDQTMIEDFITELKQERYYPTSLCSGKTPTLSDLLIVEVIRLIVQAIYEPIFLDCSHGFRPQRNCHTALVQVKTTGRGTNWIIEGDINEFSETINHARLLSILARKIQDGRLLNLIGRFLKAGYMEQQNALLDTIPHRGISPLLINIYLHELDLFIEQLCKRESAQESKAEGNQAVQYVRYLDQFLILICGPKRLAEQINKQVLSLSHQQLELSVQTTIKNPADQPVRFLGYDIARSRGHTTTLQLLVPGDIVREKIKPFMKNGKATHYNTRLHLSLPDLLRIYNAEIQRLYHYYALAADVHTKIGMFRYYHYSSLLKTVARKEQCSVAQVLHTHGIDVPLKQKTGTRKIFGVKYSTPNGNKTVTYFNESLKRRDELMIHHI